MPQPTPNVHHALGPDPELLALLACPRCRAGLTMTPSPGDAVGGGGLACVECAVVYPIVGGVPVLIVDEAVPLAVWGQKHTSKV